MPLKNRMVEAEFEYLRHLAQDGRDLYAKATEMVTLEASMTPAAVAGGAVQVAGQVVDAFGNPVAGTFDILLATNVPTSGQGHISAATSPVGTIKTGSASGLVWMQTDAAGAFAFQVADSTGGELGVVSAQVTDGLTVIAELQF